MPIQITSDNIKLSPSMEKLAISKLESVKKLIPDYSDEDFRARVVLNAGQEVDTFVVKVEIDARKIHVTGTNSGYTLESAIVGALSDVERQIKKEKTKYQTNWEKNRELKRFKTPSEDQ